MGWTKAMIATRYGHSRHCSAVKHFPATNSLNTHISGIQNRSNVLQPASFINTNQPLVHRRLVLFNDYRSIIRRLFPYWNITVAQSVQTVAHHVNIFNAHKHSLAVLVMFHTGSNCSIAMAFPASMIKSKWYKKYQIHLWLLLKFRRVSPLSRTLPTSSELH